MGCAIVAGGKPAMEAPVTGIVLADIAEGSIVKLNEDGKPVEFYVAKHNYESSLNGAGRTLLVRKDCYDLRQWDSGSRNGYDYSEIDEWLNAGYIALLGADVREAVGQTEIHYTISGDGANDLSTMMRSVFLLSLTEFGLSEKGSVNEEGAALPIASVLRVANYNGEAVTQWTRSPYWVNPWLFDQVALVDDWGKSTFDVVSQYAYSRPAFTLPASTMFDGSTLLFKGVS